MARAHVFALALPLVVAALAGCGSRSALRTEVRDDALTTSGSGQPTGCLGGPWSRALAGTGSLQAVSIAATASCSAVVAGAFQEQMTLGDAQVVADDGSDIYVAKLSSSGAPIWGRTFGGEGDQLLSDLAVDAEGAVVLAGQSSHEVDFGGGPIPRPGNGSFLAKLDGAGEHVWSMTLASAQDTLRVTAVVTDPAGAVIVRGTYDGAIDLGGGPLEDNGQTGIFVARYDEDGAFAWSRSYAGSVFESEKPGLAAGPDGDVVFTGSFVGALDLGEGPVSSGGGEHVFVVKLRSDGQVRWTRTFAGEGLAHGGPVEIGPGGHVVTASDFTKRISFGGGGSVASSQESHQNIYLVELSADGDHLWSGAFGFADAESAIALSVTETGSVTLAGNFAGQIAFGDEGLGTKGGWDVFVAHFDRLGKAIQSDSFGDAYAQRSQDMVIDREGHVLMTGTFEGGLDFGSGALAGDGGAADVFVVRGKL